MANLTCRRLGSIEIGSNNSIAVFDFGFITFYVLMLLGIGYYVYRRETSFEEYLLAADKWKINCLSRKEQQIESEETRTSR